jgi:hypothetical protein
MQVGHTRVDACMVPGLLTPSSWQLSKQRKSSVMGEFEKLKQMSRVRA